MNRDIKNWLKERNIPLDFEDGWASAMSEEQHLEFREFLKVQSERSHVETISTNR